MRVELRRITPVILAALLRFALVFWQSMVLALGQIWSNKVRSLLTMLGIIIGVTSVTAVIAALTGLKANVLSEFASIGTNNIFINIEWPRTGRMTRASWERLLFKPEQFEDMLRHCPSVDSFTRCTYAQEKLRRGDKSISEATVMGIDASWHKIENRAVVSGRPFSLLDDREKRPVCLVNTLTRDRLGLQRECTGESILVGENRFVVVGVVESRAGTSMMGREPGAEVFLPFSAAYKANRYSMSVTAAAKSPDAAEEARAEIQFFLRRQRHIQPGEPDTFRVDAIEQFVQKFREVAFVITMVASGIVGISLIVGGVGIMNIMLVSVSERTREIGLRKAVGARPSAILLQFLVEAITICFVGGLLGILGGHACAKLFALIPGGKLNAAHIPLWAVGLAFGFSALVGLAFGMFPAIKAARLDPIEALRHE